MAFQRIESGIGLRPKVKPTQLFPVDRASTYLPMTVFLSEDRDRLQSPKRRCLINLRYR
jgi:hypothetical protein